MFRPVVALLLFSTAWTVHAADGTGAVEISGAPMQWRKVTLTLDGPFAKETDSAPNPFTDRRMDVRFTHESGAPDYLVPGYFAADGNAAESSATEGTKWRAHLSPDKAGTWNYAIQFKGTRFDGIHGSFHVDPAGAPAADPRNRGRLQYVGAHYLRFAGDGEWFLKAGADAPETFLGYADFDGTVAGKPDKVPLKTWSAHAKDWRPGDPVWQGGKGKGMIGAINYLAGKGMNAFSFLTYNAGGDGDNVWPHAARGDRLHFDCSKLDQWGIVFDHATARGMFLHFKLQETENDDLVGKSEEGKKMALDGGELGVERKAYLRELIARFGHNLALNWNLGEENSQTPAQQRAMAKFVHDTDPYHHPIVIHTLPGSQDKVYPQLLGSQSELTGASLQNGWDQAHQRTLKWVEESAKAGKPWVVANDEQNPAGTGVPPDPGYKGFSGKAAGKGKNKGAYTIDDIRKCCLWGTLMAGGQGVEYYFGYKLPENDLVCEDYRSRDKSWDYCRIALQFFRDNKIPFWEMENADALVGNANHTNDGYCLAKAGAVYLVFLLRVENPELDLSAAKGTFKVRWFNPRSGGSLQPGSVAQVQGGGSVKLGQPPADPDQDWVVLVQ